MSQTIDIRPEPSNPGPKTESVLYLAILALAAFVRLYRLGLAPLSIDEALQAVAAWRGALPPSGTSPVLYAINSILFALMGTSEGLARLGSAIFGTALVGVPALLRHRLGRLGALGAALVLALSPTAIMASRALSGEIVAAAAGFGLLALGERYMQTGERKWIYALAAVLALALISGSGIYTLILIFGIAGVAWQVTRRAPANLFSALSDWKNIGIIVLAGIIGVSTLLLYKPANLSTVGELFSTWLLGFGTTQGTSPTTWQLPFQILIFYEGLALLVGLGGLTLAASREDGFGLFLGFWALATVLITSLRPGRTPYDLVLAIVPLACLVGNVVESLAQSLSAKRAGPLDLAAGAAWLITTVFGLLTLANYALNPTMQQAVGPAEKPWLMLPLTLVGLLLALALNMIVLLIMFTLVDIERPVRNYVLVLLIIMAASTWASGWGAAQVRPDDPRELLAGTHPTSLSLRLMLETLETISAEQTGDPYAMPLVAIARSPAEASLLAWSLRQFPQASIVSTLDPLSAPYVVVTPLDATPELASQYTGQDFALYTTWTWQRHSLADSLRWVFYRWSPEAPQAGERLVVWVRQELAEQITP